MWDEIIKFIGGSAVLIVAIAWLIRNLISQLLTKDIEKYKFELKRDADKEIESLRASLNLEALTHQIRYSKLHDKRAQIIAELYGRLYEFQWAVSAFLRDFDKDNEDNKTQSVQELDNKSYEFKDYFDKHRIYFTENICSTVDELVNALYSAYVPLETRDRSDDKLKQVWGECADTVRNKYPAIKASLESDFRTILGVSEK